jgi:flavodoxin
MKYQIVYFTRTGNSKRIAEKIGQHLNIVPISISDNKWWKGIIGYIRAGFYSTIDKKVNITFSKPLIDYDEIIVVSPLWAGGTAPATRAFFKMYSPKITHLVVTSIGSTLKQRSGYKSVTDIIQREKNEDEVIEKLISNLTIK